MDGMIDGGWSFVWSAYGLTWLGLLAYIFWLLRGLGRIHSTADSETVQDS